MDPIIGSGYDLNASAGIAAGAKLNNASAIGKEANKKAAQEFEAFFIGYMVDTMVKTLPTDGYFGGGHAEKVYRSLLAQEWGKEIAKSETLGLSEIVQKELIAKQAQADKNQRMR